MASLWHRPPRSADPVREPAPASRTLTRTARSPGWPGLSRATADGTAPANRQDPRPWRSDGKPLPPTSPDTSPHTPNLMTKHFRPCRSPKGRGDDRAAPPRRTPASPVLQLVTALRPFLL